jgi:hypothetical protein
MKFQETKKGAVLLIAILMASVMLTVGLGVYQRTYKEIYLASFWKQVQIAFLAADTGFECALYRDLHPPVASVYFATSSASSVTNTFSCAGGTVTVPPASFDETSSIIYKYATSTISNPSPNAFLVKIVKTTNITVGTTTTKIISHGYNDSNTSNPRRVERGLKIEY